jgi:diacylglycerol kinase family enzyme
MNISAKIILTAENELDAAIDHALQEPIEALVGAGGDGTLSAIASRLAGTGIPLGVLPLGTHNHFAKDLGIPMDVKEAVACVANCAPRPVDTGEVNGHLFINNSSIGAYPAIVEEREEKRARLGVPKWIGNIIGLVKVLRRWPLMHVRLELDGHSFSRTTPFVFVGNNEYRFSPVKDRFRERLHAGELCVFTIRARNFWALVRLFWLSLWNRLDEAGDFEAFFGRQLTIRSQRRHLRVSRDGEICRLQSPLHYRIRPGELLVFQPRKDDPVAEAKRIDESARAHLGPALRS